MEFFGIFALIIILCYSSYPGKIKRLDAKIKKLEKQRKGENIMSKLIAELKDKNCKITSERGLSLTGKCEFECYVVDSDDEWIKIRLKDKKNNEIIKMIRVEDIEEIEIM